MHDRYSPNYQIPFMPIYEAARRELQGDFVTLEEKFRRRKEMEMHDAARLAPVLAKEYELAYYHKLRLAEQEERQVASLRQESTYRHHLLSENEHLQRIELLRKERDNLEREKEYKRSSERTSPYKPNQPAPENADDDELIKKYEDGSKAKEYYMDLKIQSNRKEQDDHYAKEKQLIQRQQKEKEEKDKRQRESLQVNSHHKSHAAFTDRKANHSNYKKQQIYDTPYDIIANTSKKETFKRSPLVQQLQKQFNKIEEEKGNSRSAAKFSHTMKAKDASPLRILQESIKVYKGQPNDKQKNVSPGRSMNKYQSMGKFAPYRSKSTLSPMKKSQDGSYLQSRKLHLQGNEPKPTMKEIQLSALKKIQNRLRVSKVMYEDSQFRNVKYEENHLFNTFEIESRQRRDIKGKVNSHPCVLKKHALVC